MHVYIVDQILSRGVGSSRAVCDCITQETYRYATVGVALFGPEVFVTGLLNGGSSQHLLLSFVYIVQKRVFFSIHLAVDGRCPSCWVFMC